MKARAFIYTILLFIISSCKKESSDTHYNKKIFDLYNGTYFIESAILDSSVDINQDGISSNDLLTEIEELKFSYVNIVVRSFAISFGLGWPEQNAVPSESNEEEPVFTYNFQTQAYNIGFENDLKHILIDQPIENPHYRPYNIHIENDTITLNIKRTISIGNKKEEIVISATYKKDPEIVDSYF